MKKTVLFIAAIIFASFTINGQVKINREQKPTLPIGVFEDSVITKGYAKWDTVKCYLMVYAEDQSKLITIIRLNGYILSRRFYPADGQSPIIRQQVVKTAKWENINRDDIYDIREFLWK